MTTRVRAREPTGAREVLLFNQDHTYNQTKSVVLFIAAIPFAVYAAEFRSRAKMCPSSYATMLKHVGYAMLRTCFPFGGLAWGA